MSDTGKTDTFRARCADETCAHEWVIAYLPMEVSKVAFLARRAACPKCAHPKPKVATNG